MHPVVRYGVWVATCTSLVPEIPANVGSPDLYALTKNCTLKPFLIGKSDRGWHAVRHLSVAVRRGIRLGRGHDRGRAEEDQRALDEPALRVLDGDRHLDRHASGRDRVRVEDDVVDDQPLAGRPDVADRDRVPGTAATASAVLGDRGGIGDAVCLAGAVLCDHLHAEPLADVRGPDRVGRTRLRCVRAGGDLGVAGLPVDRVGDRLDPCQVPVVAESC